MRQALIMFVVIGILVGGCITPPKKAQQVQEQIPKEDILITKINDTPDALPKDTDDVSTTDSSEHIDPSLIKVDETAPLSPDMKIISVEETQKVNLKVQVQDPDNDELAITYDDPLDANGQWQTTYGNAGSYPITISVSDGQTTVTRDVLLVIQKKEQPPTIVATEPTAAIVNLKENEQSSFAVKAEDVNQDQLTYRWLLDGEEKATEQSYNYLPSFDDAGDHKMTVQVSDGEKSSEHAWDVVVANVNRAPFIEEIPNRNVKENELMELNVEVTDPDGDRLTTSVSSPLEKGSWQTTFNDAGIYTVTVTATDGDLSTSRSFTLTVENVNRPPVITDIIQQ